MCEPGCCKCGKFLAEYDKGLCGRCAKKHEDSQWGVAFEEKMAAEFRSLENPAEVKSGQ